MATDTQPRVRKPTVRDRKVYRLTADQVFRMIECGILPEGGNIELWDGVLYKMTKDETHNAVVGEIADRLRPLIPSSHHVPKKSRTGTANDRSLNRRHGLSGQTLRLRAQRPSAFGLVPCG